MNAREIRIREDTEKETGSRWAIPGYKGLRQAFWRQRKKRELPFKKNIQLQVNITTGNIQVRVYASRKFLKTLNLFCDVLQLHGHWRTKRICCIHVFVYSINAVTHSTQAVTWPGTSPGMGDRNQEHCQQPRSQGHQMPSDGCPLLALSRLSRDLGYTGGFQPSLDAQAGVHRTQGTICGYGKAARRRAPVLSRNWVW